MKTSPNYSLRTVFKESQVSPYRKRFACFSGPFPGGRTKRKKTFKTITPVRFQDVSRFHPSLKRFPIFFSLPAR